MDMETFILRELQRAGDRDPEDRSGSIFIRCPNPKHSGGQERTPSLRIRPDTKNVKFKCYGCGYSGHWNDLAEVLNLQKINAASKIDSGSPEDLFSEEELSSILGGNAVHTKVNPTGRTVFIQDRESKWYSDTEWRGFDGRFLRRMGALLVIDWRGRCKIRFPAYVKGKRVGHVTANLKKSKNKNIPSYLESEHRVGRVPWSHKHVLFHDQAVKILQKNPGAPIFVVEGPRDALRLLQLGIAAVALMGTQKTEDEKINTLMRFNTRVVILMDGDSAGRAAADTLEEKLTRRYATVSRVNLPDDTDPFMLPKKTALGLNRVYSA